MVFVLVSLLVLAALAVTASLAAVPTLPDEEVACAGSGFAYRTAHERWHELGQARDWESLQAQVRRWQETATPGWSESDIEQVARNLNRAVFRFAEPAR
jgi:ABC-type glycerol-3-phosphate transport system substrate-binding protein